MDPKTRSSFHRFRVSRLPEPDAEQSESAARARSSSPAPEAPASGTPSRTTKGIPACDRCRKFKKRCSRTLPVCSLCATAGQRCSFSIPPSTSTHTNQLRARVLWLEKYIADKIPGGLPDKQPLDGDREQEGSLTDTSPGTHASNREDASPGSRQEAGHDRGGAPVMTMTMDAVMNVSSESHMTGCHGQATAGSLPSNAVARKFVDAYLRNVNRAYPFVDRKRLQGSLESLDDLSRYHRTAESTLLYLVMAIGCTTLQRAGQIPEDSASKFHVSYSDIIQECVCTQSIESIQILLLLALYSLFDPFAPPAFTIMGIVARQAMVLGLTRRSSDDKALAASDVELRHRLTWSIYILDRMTCTSLGLPPAFVDVNMNTPLPGLTIEEFASPDRAQLTMILQTSRHVVQLRQLEGRIMEEIHCKRPSAAIMLSRSDRRVILQQIRADIENWYSNGCLVSPTEADNVPIHNSMTWLTARYYYLLVLLYYPCHFNPAGLVIPPAELIRYCQKHLQSTAALFHHRQLPLNTITLYRLFPVIMLLIHLFILSPADCIPFPEDETATVVAILQAFPDVWTLAHQAARITQSFLDDVADPAATNIAAAAVVAASTGSAGSVSTGGEAPGSSEAGPSGPFPYEPQQAMGQVQNISVGGLMGLGSTDANFEWGLEMDFL
ncbi:fungal-specific transcription factor domain-domain-containing protein [Microdochium bolleyi]|uniref:Fungal-specific transcription factor domain-domain-containing protein n=1 Tax=Microdochium bolleyi TaxID=196109 RepID=A0A136IPZ0_9PEZI|nr:fungal-specific transcription factor domain-domain-containing protein [Microdochium bolleyi]